MDIAAVVRPVVSRRTGLPAAELHDGLWLADPSIGLDSVALLELILECERACGCRLSSEVLEGPPLTLGALLAALRQATPERRR